MDIIASRRSSQNFSRFWKATNKLNIRPGRLVSIEHCDTQKEIANLFKDYFQVSSPLGPSRWVPDADFDLNTAPLRYSAKKVAAVVRKMSRGKSPGHDGLNIEHLKCAGIHLPRVLCMFYSLCLSHAYLPADMVKTVVIPTVKNKTGDISDKLNYRPISLATVLGHSDC